MNSSKIVYFDKSLLRNHIVMISFFLGLGHTIIGILKKGNGEIYFIMAGVLFLITASYAFVVFKFGRRFC